MSIYQRGSKGPEVTRIQERLKALGYYLGPLDGDFGGGTESAVRSFQKAAGLSIDGIVGAETWNRLFPGEAIPAPTLVEKPLAYRALALTGAFETSSPVPECFAGVSGDFDGQGLSFGALQWNLGQGSLQPLLLEMDRSHPDVLAGIFHDHYPVLQTMLKAPREEQVAWARSVQDMRRFVLTEPWRGLFKSLGRRAEFQDIQVKFAGQLYRSALTLCQTFDVGTERAVALMFDITVQNGGIGPLVRAQIERDVKALGLGPGEEVEVARLRIIANRRAEASNPRWVEDVRTRKLTIANGEGTVHGSYYQLEHQYGIRLMHAEMM